MKARIKQLGPIVLAVCLVIVVLAQWLDNSARSAQLRDLQVKVERLKLEMEKAKTTSRDQNQTQH
jgi:hypothetical protein